MKKPAQILIVVIALLFGGSVFLSGPIYAQGSTSTYDGLGISITQADDGYLVKGVLKGSPAYGKINVGDHIVTINGMFTSQRKLIEIYDLIRQKAGKRLKLTLNRGGNSVTVDIVTGKIKYDPGEVEGRFSTDDLPLSCSSKVVGKISGLDTSSFVISRDLTPGDKYKPGDLFKIYRGNEEIAVVELKNVYNDKSRLRVLEGKGINSKDLNTYRLVFFKERPQVTGEEVSPENPQGGEKFPGEKNPPGPGLNTGKNCEICGAPVRKGNKVEGALLCNRCFRKLSTNCWICNKRVSKGNGQYIYSNMFICENCLSKPMDGPAEINALYKKVQDILEKEFNMRIGASANIEISKVRGTIMGYRRSITNYYGREMAGKIGIQHKMNVLLTLATLAHEYAHEWQLRKNPKLTRLVLVEGFATWVEYKFMCRIGQRDLSIKLIEGSPQIYRDGFGIMMELEKEYGTKGVFEAVSRYE